MRILNQAAHSCRTSGKIKIICELLQSLLSVGIHCNNTVNPCPCSVKGLNAVQTPGFLRSLLKNYITLN